LVDAAADIAASAKTVVAVAASPVARPGEEDCNSSRIVSQRSMCGPCTLTGVRGLQTAIQTTPKYRPHPAPRQVRTRECLAMRRHPGRLSPCADPRLCLTTPPGVDRLRRPLASCCRPPGDGGLHRQCSFGPKARANKSHRLLRPPCQRPPRSVSGPTAGLSDKAWGGPTIARWRWPAPHNHSASSS